MSDVLVNPAATGLLGGVCVIAFQLVWKRVMGADDEKSLPAQLAEINVRLTEIRQTQLLQQNDAKHLLNDVEELKADFWRHMEAQHGFNSSASSTAHHRTYTKPNHE